MNYKWLRTRNPDQPIYRLLELYTADDGYRTAVARVIQRGPEEFDLIFAGAEQEGIVYNSADAAKAAARRHFHLEASS